MQAKTAKQGCTEHLGWYKHLSILLLYVSLPLIIILSGCSIESSQPGGHPHKLLIPQGYIGFIRIDYNVKGAPPLPVQNGAYVYRIPPYGYFKTSAPMPSGWVADEYCYVHGKVEQPLSTNEDATGMVWNDGVDTGSENNTPLPAHRSLFIGTEKQFQLTGRVGSWVGPLNPTTMKYRLQGRDFRYKDLSKHNFSHMNLVGTNLSCVLHGANLQGANLRYAVVSSDLTHASLRGANLQEADLLDGTWIDTDFTHADMRRAHLHRVEFQQAKLTGANLRGLQYDSATKWPHGFNPKQHGAILVPSVSIE